MVCLQHYESSPGKYETRCDLGSGCIRAWVHSLFVVSDLCAANLKSYNLMQHHNCSKKQYLLGCSGLLHSAARLRFIWLCEDRGILCRRQRKGMVTSSFCKWSCRHFLMRWCTNRPPQHPPRLLTWRPAQTAEGPPYSSSLIQRCMQTPQNSVCIWQGRREINRTGTKLHQRRTVALLSGG